LKNIIVHKSHRLKFLDLKNKKSPCTKWALQQNKFMNYLSAGVLAPPPLIDTPPLLPGAFKTPGAFLGADPSPLGTEEASGADGASGLEPQPGTKVNNTNPRIVLRIFSRPVFQNWSALTVSPPALVLIER
jgi:hypothetical protein